MSIDYPSVSYADSSPEGEPFRRINSKILIGCEKFMLDDLKGPITALKEKLNEMGNSL